MIEGIFVNEKKNRFLCEVLIGNELVECYVPASCHLSNFIDLHGKPVLLKRIISSNARTSYKLFALKTRYGLLPLDLAIANQVVETEITRRLFSFLGPRKKIDREVTICGYKTDLFIRDSNTIVEIKSILSLDKTALFPTVFSERSVNQLKQLKCLLQRGYPVCYCFISLNHRVKSVEISKAYPQFYDEFITCVENGMQVCAFSLSMTENLTSIKRRIDCQIT